MQIKNSHRLDGVKKIKLFCEMKVPKELRDKIRMNYEIKGNRIIIVEERPPWHGNDGPWTKHPIVQIRYLNKGSYWILYWRDTNSKWHLYKEMKPKRKIVERSNYKLRSVGGLYL